MTDPAACPKCGAPMAGDSCPRCLMAAGLESGAPGAPASTAPSPAEMQKHFPALEVLELLGQGGMGIVYRARQRNLDRAVALKVLLPEIAREAGFAERFTREARTLARLHHPHIVGVHDFGESDGLWFLVMEYVDGTNLRQVMRSGGLGPKEALAIVPQVCDALQYAHDQGIVHRDIKPENILVDRAGRVKIADFGLAKLLQRAPVELSITRTGQVMGTLHYMAPEQYKAPEGVDHRADIYSLGVVFYEMLTGELPLGAFPRPSERAGVDARLDGVVLRALEREREQRYQQAGDVKSAVTSITSGAGAAATAVSTPAAAAAMAASAPSAPVPPAPEKEMNPFARWGSLGVPIALAAGVAVWILLLPFASAGSSFRTGMGFAVLGMFLGWLVSIVGWAQIAMDRARWKGLDRAVAGTLVPPFLFCAGGFLFLPFTMAGRGIPGPIHISDGEDGTLVQMPGLTVEDGPDGTRVRMPGLVVNDNRQHPNQTVDGGPPFMDTAQRLEVRRRIESSWDDLVERWPVVGPDDADGLFGRDDRETLERMTPQERHRESAAQRLGAPYMGPSFLAGSDPREMRLVRVSLDDAAERATVVRTDGKVVLFYPALQENGRWRFRVGAVERTFVSGGPAYATPAWRADAVRGIRKWWAGAGAEQLRKHFPDTDLHERASMFRLHALALRINSTLGRMVFTDGGTTISLSCRYVDGKWEVRHQAVQRIDRAPEHADRDGWLGDGAEPTDLPEVGGVSPGVRPPEPEKK